MSEETKDGRVGGFPIPETMVIPPCDMKLEFYAFQGPVSPDHPQYAKWKASEEKFARLETPQWERFKGNNHERLEEHGCSRGGCVSFAEHLGKPLSQRLWVDLTLRLRLSGLRVYGPGELQWTDALYSTAVIRLNAAGNVVDVSVAL